MQRPRRTVRQKAGNGQVASHAKRPGHKKRKEPADTAANMPAAVSEGKKRVFDDFPPELLAYICTLVTNNDPTLLGSRGILSSMRLACRAFCRAASRIAHEHVVVSNVDHAKYVLDTILNETKPNRSSMPDGRSQSSYFVPDIRILTICHSGHASSIDLFRVLARLPTAVRRLPNLHTIVWRMPGRPSGDVIRAIAKCTHVKTLELHDTEQVPYRKGDRMSAQLLFPVLTSFVSILNLTLRLDVPRNGEFSPSDKWDSFFSSLTILSRLRSLVIEVAGSHPAPVASICGTNPELNWHDDYTWPDLRCFCVRNAMFAPRARRNAEIVVDFLERHPLLEVLDISGGFGQDHSMNSIGGESEHSSDVLKQVLSEHAKKSPPYRLGNLHTLSIDGERSSSIIEGFLSHGAVLRPIRRIGVLYPPDVARMSDATTNLTRTRADDLLSDYCIGITAAMVHSVFGPDHTTAQVLPTALPYLQELVIMEPMFYTQMEGFVNVLQQWSTKLTQLIQLTVHISQCAGDEEQVKLSAKSIANVFPRLESLTIITSPYQLGEGDVWRITQLGEVISHSAVRPLWKRHAIVYKATWNYPVKTVTQDAKEECSSVISDLAIDRWGAGRTAELWPFWR